MQETEELAAEWIEYMGWENSAPTVMSGDNGIDVIGTSAVRKTAVAQVKFEAKPTGRPAIQNLVGAGSGLGAAHFMFFSSAGYTLQAKEWADHMGVALFRFTRDGSIDSENFVGMHYLDADMPLDP